MKYVVTLGSTAKEDGNWNTDGMRATEECISDELERDE